MKEACDVDSILCMQKKYFHSCRFKSGMWPFLSKKKKKKKNVYLILQNDTGRLGFLMFANRGFVLLQKQQVRTHLHLEKEEACSQLKPKRKKHSQ